MSARKVSSLLTEMLPRTDFHQALPRQLRPDWMFPAIWNDADGLDKDPKNNDAQQNCRQTKIIKLDS